MKEQSFNTNRPFSAEELAALQNAAKPSPEAQERMQQLQALLNDFAAQIEVIRRTQIEAFLAQHLDKAGTHEVLYYPRDEEQDGEYAVYRQLIALAPKGTCVLDYRAEAVKGKFPFTYIVYKTRIKT